MRRCPVCKSSDGKTILDLGNHPLADTFLPLGRRLEPEVLYPLIFVQCEDCFHFYSGFPTEPEVRYVANEYSYESANSKLSRRHFGEFASACMREINLPERDISVLDVGSNDGTLLERFRELGLDRLVGVDPSPNMARIAERKNIRTQVSFFSLNQAKKLCKANNDSKFEMVVSANVFNHAEDPHDFLEAVDATLAEDGIFAFEVPNVVDLVRFSAFETIYHEHVHYWSIESLQKVLEVHGFKIFSVEILDYMCGSIRVFASKSLGESAKVSEMIRNDRQTVVGNPRALERFSENVRMTKFKTMKFLATRKVEGRKIVGIGAATKGNTLLNYLGISNDIVDFVADTSTEKIGKMTPGSKIPIVSDEVLSQETENTVALILPWNLDAVLRSKFAKMNFEIVTPQVAFSDSTGLERPGIYGKA